MPKTVVLQSGLEKMARELSKRGYKIVNQYEASAPNVHVDAYLYTSYHSDIVSSYTSLTEAYDVTLGDGKPDQNADISAAYDDLGEAADVAFGNTKPQLGKHPGVVMLNAVGLSPDEAADILDERL